MKSLLANLSISLLSLILFFGIAEVAVRIVKADKVRSYFDDQAIHALGDPPAKKEPGEYRIVIFGGSSAYGFPVSDRYSIAAWMRKSFPVLLPGKKVTVINCGWPGKASHDLLEGVREMLPYSPDLYLFYAGHNEATVSNRLYLDNWLYRLDMKVRYRSALYRYLTVRFDRIRKKIKYGSSGHPEKQYREEVIANKVYKRVEVDEKAYSRILAKYEENMRSAIETAQRHDIDVIFFTMPSKIRGSYPGYSFHARRLSPEEKARWQFNFDAGKDLNKQGYHRGALPYLEAAVEIDPTYAELQYELGETWYALGEPDKAREPYRLARDYDGLPFRAKTALNETIRSLSKEYGLMLADIEKLLADLSPFGITDETLIYDNVHPTVETQQLITDAALKTLASAGRIAPSQEWRWVDLDKARREDSDGVWAIDGSLSAYHYVLGGIQAWEKARYEKAVTELRRGLQLMPGFIESYGFLADAYYRLGNPVESAETYAHFEKENSSMLDYLRNKYPQLNQSYTEVMQTAAGGAGK